MHEEQKGEVTPASITNVAIQLSAAQVGGGGGGSLVKFVVFHAVQDSMWIKEEEFENRPFTFSHQCGGSNPVIVTGCWWMYFVKLVAPNTIQHSIWVKEQKLELTPSSSANESGGSKLT